MRQVALIIETTGIDPTDNICEIAAVELLDGKTTGTAFNVMIRPDTAMAEDASKLHHMANADLERYTHFDQVAEKFLAFIKGAEVIVPFSPFTLTIVNGELDRAGHEPMESVCAKISDTCAMARKIFPKEKHNGMDDVALRYGLTRAERNDRQGMRDARLLADIYVKLTEDAAAKKISLEPKTKKRNHSTVFAQPAGDAMLIDRAHAVNPRVHRMSRTGL